MQGLQRPCEAAYRESDGEQVETLQRLILTFTHEGVEIRALYRTKASPNPNTRARRGEVLEIARTGLEQALQALEGRVDVIGTSGFETKEDNALSAIRQAKGG